MHDLEMVNGKASMVFNSRSGNPWHNLGTPVDGAMTALEAMTKSNQNWTVITRDMFARNPLSNVVEKTGQIALYRSDNGALIGVAGDGYQPINNAVQFEAIDYLLEASNGAHYDTAGVLGKGERVWALAEIPESKFQVAGDKFETYLLATTSHDGSLAFTLKLAAVRVVCNNTLQMALASNGTVARIKHTKNALERVEKAKRYMDTVKDASRSLADKLNILSARRMTRESTVCILDKLFPMAKDENGKTSDRQTRRDNILADVLRLYESNDANANPAIRGTAYNLLNAVTEYTDHLRTSRVSQDKEAAGYDNNRARLDSAYFGSGEALKQKALEVIMLDTAGNPVHSVSTFAVPNSPANLLDAVVDSSVV